MKKQVAVLPGDGIGQEVMSAALDVLKAVEEQFGHQFKVVQGDIGGVAIDRHGTPLPEETLELCKSSDAVLLGAVGGPEWEDNPVHLRPEKGLLGIRKELGLFANYRPIKTFEALRDASPLKRSVVDGVDFVIVRELTGGLYFGEPRERRGPHQEVAVDTLQYEKKEIENVVRKAFELAATRSKKVTSVDKANVLESSRMWREVVEQVAGEYPEVEVEHLLVDVAAMKLVYQPKQFDVIVTENMFGDILSDEASMLMGSLGMLPSASLRADGFGLYEPVHGSAPDIAGENRANPLGMVLSVAMMLRHSFGLEEEADQVEKAVQEVLNAGYRTPDLDGLEKIGPVCTTSEMSENLVEHFQPNYAMSGILAAYM